ncbi:MAG: peptidoglycan-binding domain-containing protein [bacterium]
MPNIAKKIIATVTLVACATLMVGPGSVKAATMAELEALVASLTQQLANAVALLSQLQGGSTGGTVTGCTITSFDRSLKVGMSGDDVKCLQIILNSDAATQLTASGVGSAGSETNYFGPLTKAAAIKFQENYASEILTPLGLSSGTGYVGSSTRAKLNTMVSTSGGDTSGGDTTPTAGTNKIELAADTPGAATIAKGAQNVIFLKANVCTAAEANTISKIIVTRAGIAADTDISYVKLYDGVTQVGATQALNSTTHKATFSSLNWTIPANTCKVLSVKASIASGASQGNTPKFAINASTDITSTIALDGVFPILSGGMSIAGISAGLVEVASTTSPSGDILAGGQEQAVAGFKFTASSSEAIKLYSVTITEVGTSVDTDIANIKLFYGSTQLGLTVAALTNGKATIDFSDSPLAILAGGSKTLTVYVDVGTSIGVDGRTVQFEISANTDVTAYGSNSGGQIVAYGNTYAADTWPQQASSISVILGSLNVSLDSSYSPSAQDYSRGTLQNDVVAFKFTAGANEGIRVTQIKFQEASTSLSDADISNITLYDAETGEVVAGPATMISGYVTFGSYTSGLDASGLFDLAKSESKIVLAKADVSSGATVADTVLGFKITDVQTYIRADGLSSQNDLGTSEIVGTDSIGSTILHDIIEYGTLTAGPSSDTPTAATYAVGTSNYTFAKFELTSTGEDMLVSQFNVFFGTSTSDTASGTAAAVADVNNVKLYDGSTLLATDNTISSGYANFSITLTVAKNTTKTLTVIADIPTGSITAALQAWLNSADDVTAAGKDSGTTIAVAGTWSAANGNVMTKGAPGLAITAATVPASMTFIKNSSADLVTTLYFTASSTEDLKITKIRIAGDATTSATLATGLSAFEEVRYTANGLVVRDMVSNVKLYSGSTQIGSTVPTMTNGANYAYADFTGLSLSIPKGTTKAIDIKLDVTNSSSTEIYYYFGIATSTDVSGNGLQSGTALAAATITMGNGISGQGMVFGSAGSLTISTDVDTAVSASYVAGNSKVTMGSWKFTGTNEEINLEKIKFEVTHSAVATGSSVSYAGGTTGLFALATSATPYTFQYSVNDAATTTCSVTWNRAVATTTAGFIADMAGASSTCASAIRASVSGTTIVLFPTSAGNSVEISDSVTGATNIADNLKLGLKYGGTETIGRVAGADANVGAVYLYSGTTWLGTSYASADTSGKVVFSFPSGSEVTVPVGDKILTLKVDLSAYTSLAEGSTLLFALGNGSADYVTLITAKGKSSGTTLTTGTIVGTDDATITALTGSEMWLYATKPVVSLNGSSPSGASAPGSLKEVLRFDVTNANSAVTVNVNAIRFSVSINSTSTANNSLIWDRTFNLYKSTDPSTSIGSGISYANATSTDTTGWVTIYPGAGYQIGATPVTYILKGDTSQMNLSGTTIETLEVSIEDADFYWDDGLAANANQKVSGLPVSGNTLTY